MSHGKWGASPGCDIRQIGSRTHSLNHMQVETVWALETYRPDVVFQFPFLLAVPSKLLIIASASFPVEMGTKIPAITCVSNNVKIATVY